MFAMESPLRYMLNSATNTHNDDLITDLGPFAYAIKSIIANATLAREDMGDERQSTKDKFWCFLGMPMLDAQISDIKELEGTKKEQGCLMNLTGYSVCADRKTAFDLAWTNVEKSTTPCIVQIEFNSKRDFFKLNKPMYSPYH